MDGLVTVIVAVLLGAALIGGPWLLYGFIEHRTAERRRARRK